MKERESQLAKIVRVSLEGLAEQIKQAGVKELPIILKGDVQGSVEVLADRCRRLSNGEGAHQGDAHRRGRDHRERYSAGVGLERHRHRLQRAAGTQSRRNWQSRKSVDIRLHSIIYELQDEMKKAMLGLLEPTIKENYLGRAEVLERFRIPKVGTDRGLPSHRRRHQARRGDSHSCEKASQVFKGKISSLTTIQGRCEGSQQWHGMRYRHSNFNDVKVGDTIEAFVTERIAAVLSASS